jgi:hypothetical protein
MEESMKRLIIVWLHMFVVLSFIWARPVSASNIISTFHDDFERQALGPDYFSDTNSSDSYYVIDNGILTINSGSQDGGGRWVKSNQSYAYSPGSNGLIFETRAKIGEGERHFAVGLIGDSNDGFFGFGDLHATHQLESSTTPAPTGGLIQYIDQVDISEWHTYRIEVICSTAKYYVDGILRSVDSNPNDIPFNKSLRIIFDKGSQGTPATLSVDYVDVKIVEDSCNQPPTVNAGGAYSVNEGSSVEVTASGNDPEGGSLAYAWDLDNNGTFETPGQSVIFSVADLEALSSHTITVQATDNGGLSATDQAVVNVNFDFNGFFQPVDNLPTLNIINAGKGVPVKFSLNGYQGLNIIAAGYPTSNTVSCGSTAGDAVEQTLTAGSSSLSYDANTDQYIYVWKTDKAWVGTCRTLVIKLSDGTYHRANFKFK